MDGASAFRNLLLGTWQTGSEGLRQGSTVSCCAYLAWLYSTNAKERDSNCAFKMARPDERPLHIAIFGCACLQPPKVPLRTIWLLYLYYSLQYLRFRLSTGYLFAAHPLGQSPFSHDTRHPEYCNNVTGRQFDKFARKHTLTDIAKGCIPATVNHALARLLSTIVKRICMRGHLSCGKRGTASCTRNERLQSFGL